LTSVAGSASDVISSKSPMPAVGLYLKRRMASPFAAFFATVMTPYELPSG